MRAISIQRMTRIDQGGAMPSTLSILILGSDVSEVEAVAAQFETDQAFEIVRMAATDLAASKSDLERLDAILALPSAHDDEIKRFITSDYRGPIIGLGRYIDGSTEQISLPVKAATLLQRVRVHLINVQSRSDRPLTIGRFMLYPSSRLLIDSDGHEQKVTDREVDILRYLHRARGQIVSRETLLTEVWGYHESVTTHTLETHIYRIRQKIEADPNSAQIILTEPGGYRLVEPFKEN